MTGPVPGPGGEERRFVALMLSPEAAAAVARALEQDLELAPGDAGPGWLRRVRTVDLHLTLFFLGEAPPEAWSAAWEGARAAAARAQAPQLVLDRLGRFPGRGPPRVLWAGVAGPGLAALRCLQAEVAAAAEGAGFEPDRRPWSPHATLARVRPHRHGSRGPRLPAGYGGAGIAVPWSPGELVLARSRPAVARAPWPAGAAYEAVERCALAGA